MASEISPSCSLCQAGLERQQRIYRLPDQKSNSLQQVCAACYEKYKPQPQAAPAPLQLRPVEDLTKLDPAARLTRFKGEADEVIKQLQKDPASSFSSGSKLHIQIARWYQALNKATPADASKVYDQAKKVMEVLDKALGEAAEVLAKECAQGCCPFSKEQFVIKYFDLVKIKGMVELWEKFRDEIYEMYKVGSIDLQMFSYQELCLKVPLKLIEKTIESLKAEIRKKEAEQIPSLLEKMERDLAWLREDDASYSQSLTDYLAQALIFLSTIRVEPSLSTSLSKAEALVGRIQALQRAYKQKIRKMKQDRAQEAQQIGLEVARLIRVSWDDSDGWNRLSKRAEQLALQEAPSQELAASQATIQIHQKVFQLSDQADGLEKNLRSHQKIDPAQVQKSLQEAQALQEKIGQDAGLSHLSETVEELVSRFQELTSS